ncbi:hypothetical protein QZH41_008129, partial [Actinostola sp. cb2023]
VMEASGVVMLFQRSIEKMKLRYTPFVGDGDSKAYTDVCKAEPYGPAVFIPKEECISHVTKRMGTALRNLVKDWKGEKLADGKCLAGAGRLTLKRIDTIQGFYGSAIRNNKGSAKEMAKAARAILKRYSSEAKHDDCTNRKTSWCTYQWDQANHTNLHKPIKNGFTPAIVEAV